MSAQEPKKWDVEHHRFAVQCRMMARWVLDYAAKAGRLTAGEQRQVNSMAGHIRDLGPEYSSLLDFPHGDQLLVDEQLMQEALS